MCQASSRSSSSTARGSASGVSRTPWISSPTVCSNRRSVGTGDVPGGAEEYAVMDRAGRVQVPREFREALALTRRVRLTLETDHVRIRSDREDPA